MFKDRGTMYTDDPHKRTLQPYASLTEGDRYWEAEESEEQPKGGEWRLGKETRWLKGWIRPINPANTLAIRTQWIDRKRNTERWVWHQHGSTIVTFYFAKSGEYGESMEKVEDLMRVPESCFVTNFSGPTPFLPFQPNPVSLTIPLPPQGPFTTAEFLKNYGGRPKFRVCRLCGHSLV